MLNDQYPTRSAWAELEEDPKMHSDLLLRATSVISPAEGVGTIGTHISIRDGVIEAIGGRELEALEHRQTIDFGDGAILPGLVDVHMHPVWGSASRGGSIGCAEARNLEDLRALLTAAIEADPDSWVDGYDLDVNVFPGGEPDGRVFEQWFPGRKVILMTRDAHALVVSPAVVDAIGLTGEETFADTSEIVTDASGVTGWIVELQAMDLVLNRAPEVPLETHADYLAAALGEFARSGLTEVHALDFHEPSRTLYTLLEDRGELPVRVRIFPLVPADSTPEEWAVIADQQHLRGARWGVDGVKFMLDGTADNGTAWFSQPDCAGENRASLWRDPESYRAAVRFFTERGVPTATHAIGDQAVRFALDVFAEVGPAGNTPHRIEHIESIPDDLLDRFRDVGAVASLQPTHATRLTQPDQSDNWSKRIGPERVAHGWRIRDLIAHGAVVVLGSDWPIGIGDPRISLADAQLRRPVDEPDHLPHQPGQRITAQQAYTSMTAAPAIAGGIAEERGRIAVGMAADLVVFAENPLVLAPERQAANPVLATFIAGNRTLQD